MLQFLSNEESARENHCRITFCEHVEGDQGFLAPNTLEVWTGETSGHTHIRKHPLPRAALCLWVAGTNLLLHGACCS